MNHSISRAACLTAGFALFAVAGPGRAQSGSSEASADSARAALERELAAFAIELETDIRRDDPFQAGRTPDLLVLSTAEVFGELAPCG